MHLPVGGGPPSVGPPHGVLDADALFCRRHGLLRQVNVTPLLHNKVHPLQDHREMVEKRTAGLQHLQRICLGFLL